MLKLAKISTKSEISIWHHQIGKILAKDAYGDIFANYITLFLAGFYDTFKVKCSVCGMLGFIDSVNKSKHEV